GCVRSTSRSASKRPGVPDLLQSFRSLLPAAAGPADTAALLWLRLRRAALYGWLLVVALALTGAWCSHVHADVLVATNSSWRFRKGTSEASSPTNAWRAVAFDDSSWDLGVAPFYYDTDNIYTGKTLLSNMQNGYTCIFMRQQFVVTNLADIAMLTLRSWCDDGYVVWLNGTRLTNFN